MVGYVQSCREKLPGATEEGRRTNPAWSIVLRNNLSNATSADDAEVT